MQLCQLIDNKKQAKILIRDLVEFIKNIPGKFNRDLALKKLASDIEEPI